MLISYAIDEYMGAKQNNISHDTYKWYLYHLRYLLKWCEAHSITELEQITPAKVQQAVADHPRTNTNTRHGLVQAVKVFLNWCAADDEFGVKPKTVQRIDLPKAIQPDIVILSDEELHRLFRACDKTRHPHRNRAILYTLLETGVRASELCFDAERPKEETGLLMENLILGRGTESYIRVTGKGNKVRTVPIGDSTRQIIQKYLHRERGKSENPYVFLAQGGLPLSVKRLEETLHVLGEHAGVEDVHPHRMRHTFAIKQLLAGTSSFVLMQLMGHTSLEATKIYTRALTQYQSRRAATSVVDEMKRRRATN